MLNIINLVSTLDESLEIDPYIPVKIRWGQWNLIDEPTIYWRVGDFKNSLVEIGVSSNSGLIRSFTFVCSKDIFLTNAQVLWPKSYDEGTPMFDISEWPENGRLDEQGLAEIYFNGDDLSVLFSHSLIIKKTTVSGRVCFGFNNDNNLCAIKIFDLTEEEKEQIKDTLNYMSN
jgi:hypothetical protein